MTSQSGNDTNGISIHRPWITEVTLKYNKITNAQKLAITVPCLYDQNKVPSQGSIPAWYFIWVTGFDLLSLSIPENQNL